MIRIFIAALCAVSLSAFAQNPIRVDAVAQVTGMDTQVTFSVDIPQAPLKAIEKHWLKYVGAGSKERAVVDGGIHLKSRTFNDNISANSFHVHSRLLETSEGVRLSAWFSQNNSPLVANKPNSDNYLAVQKYVRDFAVQEYRLAVQQELKAEQDKLTEMEKELDELVKKKEKSMQKISENERSTERANDAIATNNSDILSSSGKIGDQKELVDATASDSKATKGAKKTLNDLENEKEGFQKDNETQGKNNDSRDKENREEERSIAGTQQDKDLKKSDIVKQRQKVYEVQTKLDIIG